MKLVIINLYVYRDRGEERGEERGRERGRGNRR